MVRTKELKEFERTEITGNYAHTEESNVIASLIELALAGATILAGIHCHNKKTEEKNKRLEAEAKKNGFFRR